MSRPRIIRHAKEVPNELLSQNLDNTRNVVVLPPDLGDVSDDDDIKTDETGDAMHGLW